MGCGCGGVKKQSVERGGRLIDVIYTGDDTRLIGPATRRDYGDVKSGDMLIVHENDIERDPQVFNMILWEE